MSGSFRVGIVGCGKIAPRHVRACLMASGVELAALVDPVESRAGELALRFDVSPRLATRVEDVVSDLDAVVVAVPNHLHREVAVACLRARVPVLIEKPLATSVADGDAIRRASEEHGALVAVAYVTRFGDSVQLMGDLLARRHFGTIRKFAYQAGSRGSWSPLSAYNLSREAAGGGVLVVTGTHFLDRMLAWFGYPAEMTLEDDGLEGPEANVVASFRFDDGLEGAVRLSKTVSLPAGIVMEAEAGRVMLLDGADSEIIVRPADPGDVEMAVRRVSPRAAGSTDLFVRQLQDFVAAVRGASAPMVSVEQGLDSLRAIEALYARRTPISQDWYRTEEGRGLAS